PENKGTSRLAHHWKTNGFAGRLSARAVTKDPFQHITRIALYGFVLLVSGCCLTRQCQLEHVAKDWCMTIRASQVIPVYPLTEDIQPGDVFLVQVPIDRQQQVYEDKGFLPLDNHITRLKPSGYKQFYTNSFLPGTNSVTLPLDWIRPSSTNFHSGEPAP